MTVTLGVVLSEVLKLGSKPAASLATSLAKSKTWAFRASYEAFKKVPGPRPRRALAAWLKSPETMRDVILAPGRPSNEVVRDVNQALVHRSKRWSRLPPEVRRERAEAVAVAVYSSALSAHSPGWATRIASERSQAAHGQTHEKLDVLTSGVEEILQRLTAAPVVTGSALSTGWHRCRACIATPSAALGRTRRSRRGHLSLPSHRPRGGQVPGRGV